MFYVAEYTGDQEFRNNRQNEPNKSETEMK